MYRIGQKYGNACFRSSPLNKGVTQKSKYKFLLQIFCVNFEWRSEGRISYRLGATLGMDP